MKVASKDGTTIAFDQIGSGPPVILVCGGSTDRTANADLATLLASDFTVLNYDRRGRGDSGDTPPYAIEREYEDLDGTIAAAGGSAAVYGISSGAVLALKAAASGLGITRLALFEPPYVPEGERRPPANTAATFTELVEDGRRDAAVEFFMSEVVGLPAEFVAGARAQPFWASQEAIAHTLAYDATIMDDYRLRADEFADVQTPTLVLDGGASFSWFAVTMQQLADALPNARRHTLEGQQHNVDAAALAPVLVEFFGSP
jgi:alpha-beta hydrolase superfamily lysophospholipase